MSHRGRGNGPAIKRGGPNLALAGKRENQNESARKTEREKRGRGGRGRGGRGRGDNKIAFIQTEGIFSEGLHATPTVKREADTDYIGAARATRNGTAKKGKPDEAMETDEKTKGFGGWEEEWDEDIDEEMEELNALLGGADFISNYKKGDRLPIVLPDKDEAQFHKIMSKHAKHEIDGRVKPIQYQLGIEANPIDFLSRKAGETLLNAFENKSDETLVFMQLPSAVNVLSATKQIKEEADIDNQIQSPASSHAFSEFPDIPRGKKIGKIQITKSGKTLLRIGDTVLNISQAAPSEIQENAILLETKPDPSPMYHTGLADTGTNAVYHIGEVKHHYVASVEWGDLKKNVT